MATSGVGESLARNLFVLQDEDNPRGSLKNQIFPSTTLDQVFDQTSPEQKTLRQIIAELREEILTGGRGNIVFPVTSVNDKLGAVLLTQEDIGLQNVDNVADADKPLSNPQRAAILDMLDHFDVKAGLTELYDHIASSNNPHSVTFEQITAGDNLQKYILELIGQHNYSTNSNVHNDIRRSVKDVWNQLERFSTEINDEIQSSAMTIDSHVTDPAAHVDLFALKESTANKTEAINTETSNYVNYPSTRAVAEFVIDAIAQYHELHPNVESWIADVNVVRTKDDLPDANSSNYRTAYFIQVGDRSFGQFALCRFDPSTEAYYWDTIDLGGYSKFNEDHFVDTPDGLSFNVDQIVEEFLGNKGILEEGINNRLSKYYTKADIDAFEFVRQINIETGTQDGTIRYYINGDPSTMSDDIEVAGLKRLAYLEYVTENELWDHCVHTRHILNRAVINRHLDDRAVTAEKVSIPKGYILGNLHNDDSTAEYLSIEDIANAIKAYL